METKISHEGYIKKLIKILHQKEKQIDQYRRLIKNNNHKPQLQTAATWNSKFNVQDLETEITMNRTFIKQVNSKVTNMQTHIIKLQKDLQQEEQKNDDQQQELNHKKQELIQSKIMINKLQQQLLNKQNKILELNKYRVQQQNQISKLNELLEAKIQQIEDLKQKFHEKQLIDQQFFHCMTLITQKIKEQHEISEDLDNQITMKFKLNNLQNQQKKCYNSILQLIKELRIWQKSLQIREISIEERANTTINGGSQLNGFTRFLKSNTKINNTFVEDSVFIKQQEELLKQLEQQMKQEIQLSGKIQNQKQIELNQARQSLKMTKQVNQQLFDQIGRLDTILNECKSFIIKLIEKGQIKNENKDMFVKILSLKLSKKQKQKSLK